VAALARGAQGKLPRDWLQAVALHCDRQGQAARALRVHRVLPAGASEGRLEPGDIVLGVNGRPIACCFDIESALAPPPPVTARAITKAKAKGKGKAKAKAQLRRPAAASDTNENRLAVPAGDVSIKVFRSGTEIEVSVKPSLLGSQDEGRLIMWAGFVLRSPPRCVFDRCGSNVVQHFKKHPGSGVFVQRILAGSPAESRELVPQCFLIEIDGVVVHGLEDVLTALKGGAAASQGEPTPVDAERRWVRLRLMDLFGGEHARALQCDTLFFPTLDLQRAASGWQCQQVS